MLPPLKVLLFSVSIGAGHDSVANSVAQEIRERSPLSQVKIVDTFQYINPFLNKVVVGSYMETLKFTPKFWGYLYNQAEEGDGLVDLGQIFSKLLSPKMVKLLQDFEPDVIVCSHAFPVGILSVLKKKGKINTPLVACITDFTVHNFWINSYVDLFVIPQEDLMYPLLKEEVPVEKIEAYGIPIRRQFLGDYSKKEIRKKLGLNDQKTVLVMGGGLGLGHIEEITSKLMHESDLQVLVVAGKNEKLQKELEGYKKDNRLHIFGFVENIAEIMKASDILLSKPGGVTTAEALAMELPIIIFSSLPGQEDRNTHYLLNKGIAIKVRKIDELVFELNSLLDNRVRFRQMKEMLADIKKADSTVKTVDKLWDLANKKVESIEVQKAPSLKDLEEFALSNGASRARFFDAESIVYDPRVRLKYRFSTPNMLPAEEIKEIIKEYEWAILVQVVQKEKDSDKVKEVHELVKKLEEEAQKMGCYLASAFSSKKYLSKDSSVTNSFEEAGIDIYKTAKNIGMNYTLNSDKIVTYNGLILLK